MNAQDFEKIVSFKNDGRADYTPDATVVIVIYNSGKAVLEMISSLKTQTCTSFEIIVVDNGKNDLQAERLMAEPLLYVKSRRNSLSLGRNIGVAYARSGIVIFLDDDCIAHSDLVGAHIRCYHDPGILGVRGKALPKSKALFHHFQAHYDLGPKSKPAVIGLEGNSSLRKSILDEIGGFNPELFGAEGLELSYRIIQKYKRPGALIYSPEPIIFHDFAKSLLHYLKKCYRHPKMRKKLFRQNPSILQFARGYGPYNKPDDTYSSLREALAVKIVGLFGRAAELTGRYY